MSRFSNEGLTSLYEGVQQVTDPTGAMYRLRYDVQGRVDSLVISALGGAVGVREARVMTSTVACGSANA